MWDASKPSKSCIGLFSVVSFNFSFASDICIFPLWIVIACLSLLSVKERGVL